MSTTFTNTGVGDGIIYGIVNFGAIGIAPVANLPVNYGYTAVARVYTNAACTTPYQIDGNNVLGAASCVPGTTSQAVTISGVVNETQYWVRTYVNNGVDGEVGESIIYTFTPTPPLTTLGNVTLGDGTITATVDRTAFQDRSNTMYAELRAFSDSACTTQVGINVALFASGATQQTVSVTGLSNESTYYIKTAVNAGDNNPSFGFSQSSGPYTLPLPVAQINSVAEGITGGGKLSVVVSRAMFNNRTNTWSGAVRVFSNAAGTAEALYGPGEPIYATQQFAEGEETVTVTVTGLTNGTSYYLRPAIAPPTGNWFGQGDVTGPSIPRVPTYYFDTVTASDLATATNLGSVPAADFAHASATQIDTMVVNNKLTQLDASKLSALQKSAVTKLSPATLGAVFEAARTVDATNATAKPTVADILTKSDVATFASYANSQSSADKAQIKAVVGTTLEGYISTKTVSTGGSKADADKLKAAYAAPIITTGGPLNAPKAILADSSILGAPAYSNAPDPTGKEVAIVPDGTTNLVVSTTTGAINLGNNVSLTLGTTPVTVTTTNGGTIVTYNDGTNTTTIDKTNEISMQQTITLGPNDYTLGMKGTTTIVKKDAVGVPSAAVCFLADAPVLTPAGYRPISSIAVGDKVCTAAGRAVTVKRVFAKQYEAGPAVNPFVIPKGSFGALRALPISPNHEVMTAKGMVAAKDLGLKRMKMTGSFTYYNLELEDWVRDNLVVAGVECESLAPASRITMTKAEFTQFVRARYGFAAAARLRLQSVCFEEADGSVSLPAFK